jgi:hypothetical protein
MKIVGCLLPLVLLAILFVFVTPHGEPIRVSPPPPARPGADLAADIRFAFVKVIAGEDGAPDQTGFLITRRFPQPGGTVRWLDRPRAIRLGIGDDLGGIMVESPPGGNGFKVAVDFRTPFVLVGIHRDVQRTLFYEIRTVPRVPTDTEKNLKVMAKIMEVDVAVLRNTTTGALLEMPRLMPRIRRPSRLNAIYDPIIPDDPVDEVQQFTDHPADYVPSPLTPPAPIRHAPDEGPLEDLRSRTGDGLMKTDTDYYEFADGRLVWWEPLNHRLRVYPAP